MRAQEVCVETLTTQLSQAIQTAHCNRKFYWTCIPKVEKILHDLKKYMSILLKLYVMVTHLAYMKSTGQTERGKDGIYGPDFRIS